MWGKGRQTIGIIAVVAFSIVSMDTVHSMGRSDGLESPRRAVSRFHKNHTIKHVIWHKHGTVAGFSCETPIPEGSQDYVELAYQFLDEYRGMFGLAEPRSELKLKEKSYDPGSKYHHIDFEQFYKGIRVYDTNLRINFRAGNFKGVSGRTVPWLSLDVVPLIDSLQAKRTMRELLPASSETPLLDDFELVIWSERRKSSLRNHLAWHALVGEPGSKIRLITFVDAVKGGVLRWDPDKIILNPTY